ncbi:MAG: hypothetical protein S0880_19205 [Actinomycetota bacterium]|nr:hypothetical protein [Actinomycetota bacterium]
MNLRELADAAGDTAASMALALAGRGSGNPATPASSSTDDRTSDHIDEVQSSTESS